MIRKWTKVSIYCSEESELACRLLVGTPALESKGLPFHLNLGLRTLFLFVHKCPHWLREIKIDISVHVSGKCARKRKTDLVGTGCEILAILRETQFE